MKCCNPDIPMYMYKIHEFDKETGVILDIAWFVSYNAESAKQVFIANYDSDGEEDIPDFVDLSYVQFDIEDYSYIVWSEEFIVDQIYQG